MWSRPRWACGNRVGIEPTHMCRGRGGCPVQVFGRSGGAAAFWPRCLKPSGGQLFTLARHFSQRPATRNKEPATCAFHNP